MTEPLYTQSQIESELAAHAEAPRMTVEAARAMVNGVVATYEAERAEQEKETDQFRALAEGQRFEIATLQQQMAVQAGNISRLIEEKLAIFVELNHQETEIADLKRQLAIATRPDADAYLTIGTQPIATSQFRTGFQDVDDKLRLGSQVARDKLAAVMEVGATHVMNFGAPDLWPNEADGKPTKWWALDERMKMFANMGVEIAMIGYNLPYWMKERVLADGTTRSMDATKPFEADGRARLDKYPQLYTYFYEIAKRYLPKGVRIWVYGNELKGFWFKRDGTDGYAMDEYVAQADIATRAIEDAAIALSIDSATLRFGAPYPAVRSEATRANDTYPTGHPYGYFRNAPFEAIQYCLDHARRVDFIAFDIASGNTVGGELLDAFTVARTKYADAMAMVRAMTDPARASLPVIVTELYDRAADDNDVDPQRNAAVSMVSHLSMIECGYEQAWLWGAIGQGKGNQPNGGLLRSYMTGEENPWYQGYKIIREHFSAGAKIYPVEVEGEGIFARATDAVTVAVNISTVDKRVCVDKTVYVVAPNTWLVVERAIVKQQENNAI